MTTSLWTGFARRGMIAAAIGTASIALLAGCGSQGWPGAAVPTPSATASTTATPTAGATDVPADAVTYASDHYGYSMSFPGKPQVVTAQQTVAGQDVAVEVAQYAGDSKSGMVAEAIGFKAGAFDGADPQVILGSSLGGLVASAKGTVVSQTTTKLDGAPAVRAEVTIGSADSRGEFVLAIHGDTEYVVFAAGSYADAFDAYLATFKFSD